LLSGSVFRKKGEIFVFLWGEQNILWVLLLLASVIASVAGVLLSGFFNQAANPRPHNGTKLFNECLGKHQIAYFLYLANMSIGGKFDPSYPWMKYLVWCGALVSFIFYAYGLYSSTVQDRTLSEYPSNQRVPKSVGLRIWGLNLLFASLSFTGGIVSALLIKP
jgi:hypothetical protein